MALQLRLIALEDVAVNLVVAPVDSVLDRPHQLVALGEALEVKVGAVLSQDAQHTEVLAANREKDPADAVIVPLLIHVNLAFPVEHLILLALIQVRGQIVFAAAFVLFGRVKLGVHHLRDRLVEEELDDLLVAALDCHVQARGAFRVSRVRYIVLLEERDDGEVLVVRRVVEAIEALRVELVHRLAQRALHQDGAHIKAEQGRRAQPSDLNRKEESAAEGRNGGRRDRALTRR